MADKKISALTAATTPLAGTEVLPIVQSGSTVKVAVSDLTAGRSVSAASLALTTSPLPATSGGTGQSSAFTANAVVYSSSTSALATGSALFFDGTNFGVGGTTQSGTANKSFVKVASKFQQGLIDTTAQAAGVGGAVNLGGNYRAAGDAQAFTRVAAEKANATDSNYAYNMAFYTTADGGASFGIKNLTMLSTGDTKVETGNLVQGTAAKGVNFTANTPAAGMTSQLLNWYEEGTWTPAQGSGLTLVGAFSSSGTYVRIGRMVTVTGLLQGATSIAVAAGGVITNNLPYSIGTGNAVGRCLDSAWTSACDIIPSAANLYGATAIGATSYIFFSITYQV